MLYTTLCEKFIFSKERSLSSQSVKNCPSPSSGVGVGLIVTISNRELIFPLQFPAGDTAQAGSRHIGTEYYLDQARDNVSPIFSR